MYILPIRAYCYFSCLAPKMEGKSLLLKTYALQKQNPAAPEQDLEEMASF